MGSVSDADGKFQIEKYAVGMFDLEIYNLLAMTRLLSMKYW